MKTIVAQVAIALLFSMGAAPIPGPGQSQSAAAQTAAPGKAAPAAKAPGLKRKKPRSAASIECSRQADAKDLHGEPRKRFRRACLEQAAMLKRKKK